MTKSRSLAQKLAAGGRLRINREKVSAASKQVRVGDVLTIALDRKVLVLKVQKLGTRRGPFSEAQLLYEDLTPPPRPAARTPVMTVGQRDPGTGRPTKKDRRRLEALREQD